MDADRDSYWGEQQPPQQALISQPLWLYFSAKVAY